MASNSPSSVLGLLVLLQLAGFLALALGSLYFLYCLGRSAAGIDRLASVAEAWLVWQQTSAARAPQSQTAPSVQAAPPSQTASPAQSGVVIEPVEAATTSENFNLPAPNRGENPPL